jgi:hypothetical protein
MAGIELCKFTHGLGLYIRILPRAWFQLVIKDMDGNENGKLSNFTINKGNNKITELRTILQRESQNS